jgi:2-C-methyl-D-erythritol 4-phosphate cytidylyltransferase
MLLLAAGRGSRFGGPLPKAWLPLSGKPLLVHSIERLDRVATPAMSVQVIVAVHPEDRRQHLAACLPAVRAALSEHRGLQIVDGGETRQESMQRCLEAAGQIDLVLVHDAARPLLPIAATRKCIEAAAATGAALLAIPAPDTLKRVGEGTVAATIDRSGIWLAQTPQVIRRTLLLQALEHARTTGFVGTDDVSLIEHLGARVAVVPGSPANLKITRPEDLPLAEAMLAARLE